MLTEEAVLAALPPQGFLHDFVNYASWCTDAHMSYHIPVGLACIAQTVPLDYHMRFSSNRYANIFGLCVGASGESRKSASLSIGRDILEEALPGCVGETPGSKENVIDSLRKMPRQVIMYSEFGKFLAESERGYLNPIRTTLNDAADCIPLGRGLVRKDNTEAKTPRLSLLGGSTLAYLEEHTTPVDWTGGFLARFLTMYADRQRTYREPPSTVNPVLHEQRRQYMIQYLRWLAQGANGFGGLNEGTRCLGFDEGARKMWNEWYERLESFKRHATEETRGLVGRAHEQALKIALLLTWDYGGGRSGQSFYITTNELLPAVRITELHLDSVIRIGGNLASGRDMQDRRKVFNCIGLQPRPLGEIIGSAKLLKKRTSEIIETLLAEGVITRIAGAGLLGEWFRRTTDEERQATFGAPLIPVLSAPPQKQQGDAQIIHMKDYVSSSPPNATQSSPPPLAAAGGVASGTWDDGGEWVIGGGGMNED